MTSGYLKKCEFFPNRSIKKKVNDIKEKHQLAISALRNFAADRVAPRVRRSSNCHVSLLE